MAGREELQKVFSLVDMSKIDLPSYNISTRKYDDIAKVYTKVIFLLSYLEVCTNPKETEEDNKRLAIAKKTLEKISQNPLAYSYDISVQQEKEIIQKATDDLYSPYISKDNPRIKAAQNSVKKSAMIKNMKQMLESLHSFNKNQTDNVVDFCMSDENFERKMQEYNKIQQEVKEFDANTQQIEQPDEPTDIAEPNSTDEVCENKKPSFWKRLFGKKGQGAA